MESQRENSSIRMEVARRLTHPITLVSIALLVLELLIALVVIFSRMSAGLQFVCVLLMAVPMLAFVVVAVRTTMPRTARQPAPSTERLTRSVVDAGDHEALDLVSRLEDLADNTRKFPLNITAGFDEEQFTYTTLKLRAAVQDLVSNHTDAPPDPPPKLPAFVETVTQPIAVADLADSLAEEPAIAECAAEPSPVDLAATLESEGQPDQQETEESGQLIDAIASARDALRKRDSDEAIRLLSSINGAAEASELLGIAYELAGNRPAALDALKVAIHTDSDRASAHFNYAVILAKEQRLDDAVREANIALELNPDYASARELVKSLDRPREVLLR